MKEIHDGNDEGLINLKQEFIAKANKMPGVVENMETNAPLNLFVREISFEEAETFVESFSTTKVYFKTELEKEEVRMLTTAFRCELNGKYYRLQFFTSTVESEDLIKNMLYLMLGLWIALSLTLFIVSKVILLKANKPFYKLLDELKKFRLDNRQMIDFPVTNIREYSQLNESVKELLTKNIDVFTEQKIFIENTSHELQTPLAIAIAKMDLLMEKHQDKKDLLEEIAAILNILNRMKHLNKNLLLLSNIKNHQFFDVLPVNLRNIVETVLADFEDFIQYKQITIEKEGYAMPLVTMNENLATILFTNLIKNAITHNHENGKIIIHYTPDSIVIANSGQNAVADVFSRYSTTTADEKSSGLGLSIVKSITDLYPIDILYHYDGMHIFTLKLH
jgi:signal transduction histidine kinase